jgi:hypothetical protein
VEMKPVISIEPAAVAGQATSLMAPPAQRVDTVDVLRGAAMILIVIDHACDRFGNAAVDVSADQMQTDLFFRIPIQNNTPEEYRPPDVASGQVNAPTR